MNMPHPCYGNSSFGPSCLIFNPRSFLGQVHNFVFYQFGQWTDSLNHLFCL